MVSVTPILSVIIPTHNRPEALQRTLGCLTNQALPGQATQGAFEVIVVDNGAKNEHLQSLPSGSHSYPFELSILRHEKQGPTEARNLGAQRSQAETLVFLDDDICISPAGLSALLDHCRQSQKTIYLGALTLPQEILQTSAFARSFDLPIPPTDEEIHYTFCKTGLLAVRKEDFFDLGLFQDPTGGWPNWDDVDFGCRAHRQGYRFWLCVEAVGEHWDYAALSLEQASQRLQRAGASAVRLFQVYPELQDELPMFRDMLPYNPGKDTSRMAIRKVARRLASNRQALWSLEQVIQRLEKLQLSSDQMRIWYTWVLGGYIFRGVQEGICKYGPLPKQS